MNGIVTPSRGDLSLDRFVTTEAQKRGRAFFFGNEAKCSKCHSGPTLAFSDGSLPGTNLTAEALRIVTAARMWPRWMESRRYSTPLDVRRTVAPRVNVPCIRASAGSGFAVSVAEMAP